MKSSQVNIKPERYVPDIKRAQDELGLTIQTSLEHAIQATDNWSSFLGQNNAN